MQPKESKSSWHFTVSLLKSLLRLTAGVLLSIGFLILSGIFFIVAEIFGIVEEL